MYESKINVCSATGFGGGIGGRDDGVASWECELKY